jgi:hypothetical protein
VANPENLTPYAPGTSGNPAGRPPGRTVSARLQELLDADDKTRNGVAAAILKGIGKGNVAFVKLFIDRTEGRLPTATPESRGPAPETIHFYLPDNGRTRSAGPEDHPAELDPPGDVPR